MDIYDAIVVGGGVFGTAVVEAVADSTSYSSVLWIYDDQNSASYNLQRIIRAEYDDIAYRELANEAITAFKTDKQFVTHFDKSGWFLIQDEQGALNASIPKGQEAVEDFRRHFPTTTLDENEQVTKASDVGWVEADESLKSKRDRLSANSKIHQHTGTVTSITRENSWVISASGRYFGGKTVILATGWRTNHLLSAHGFPSINYDVVGVPVLVIQLNEEQRKKHANKPIICDPLRGEILPPTPKGLMTINNPRSYLMRGLTEAPEVEETHDCFVENRKFLTRFYPELRDCPTKVSLLCLDAYTPYQSFFFQQAGDDLYCVGGGSFHGWKFLPVLPRLLASRLQIDGYNHDENKKEWEELTKENKKHSGLTPTRDWV